MAKNISNMRDVTRHAKGDVREAHARLSLIEEAAARKNRDAAKAFMQEHGASVLVFELEGGGDEEQVMFREAKDAAGTVLEGVSPDFTAVAGWQAFDGDEIVVGEIDSGWGACTELGMMVQSVIWQDFGGWGTNDGYSGLAEMKSDGTVTYDLDPNPHREEDHDF